MILPWLSLFFHSFFCQLNSYDNQLLLPPALMLPVFVKSSSDFFFYQIFQINIFFLRKHFLFKLSRYIQTHEEIISLRQDTCQKYQVAWKRQYLKLQRRTKIRIILFHENNLYDSLLSYHEINILTFLLFFDEIPSYLKMHPHSSCQIIFFFGENYENIK